MHACGCLPLHLLLHLPLHLPLHLRLHLPLHLQVSPQIRFAVSHRALNFTDRQDLLLSAGLDLTWQGLGGAHTTRGAKLVMVSDAMM